jgi:uncharacterized membrane protein
VDGEADRPIFSFMKRATVLGHSLHPMLIVFPLGLLITSLVWDIVYLASGNPMWGQFSYWSIVAGIIGGLAAAIPGFIDWLAIPHGTRASRVGTMHMFLNLCVLALFGLSLALRSTGDQAAWGVGAMVPGWIAIALGGVSSWLGGELVERLGIGVDERPDVNAPSSLETRRADEPQRPSGQPDLT